MVLKTFCCFAILAGFLSIATAQAAQDEKLTLTTYYPSPTGVYLTLRLAPTNEPAANPSDTGMLYYNQTENDYRYFNGTLWKKLGGGWWDIDAAGLNITNINTGNVIVGNTTNRASLRVFGDAQIGLTDSPQQGESCRIRVVNNTIFDQPASGKDALIIEKTDDDTVVEGGMVLGFSTSSIDNSVVGSSTWADTFRPVLTLRYDSTSTGEKVGIGTTSPTERLHVVGNLTGDTEQQPVLIEGRGEVAMKINSASDTANFNSQIQGHRSRGTIAAPTSVVTGDTLIDIRGYGYNGVTYPPAGEINIKADEPNPVGAVVPGRIEFQTTDTAGSLSARMMIINNGDVGIGSYPLVGKLYVKGNINAVGNIAATGSISATGAISATGNLNAAGSIYAPTGDVYARGVKLTSDKRWKKNVTPYPDALKKVGQLQGVSFDWDTEHFPGKGFSAGRQLGVIGQDIEKVIPELVSSGDNGDKYVDYDKIAVVLIEAVKEQQKEIEILKNKIDAMNANKL